MTQDADTQDTVPKLFKAIEAGDLAAVRTLLAANPSLAAAQNKDGASALTWATYYRRKEICDALLGGGLKPDIFEASGLGLRDRVEAFLESDRGLVDHYSFDGWTPLHLAAHFGHLDTMRTLLANGADHRAISRNSNRNQPLQAAAAGGQTAAVGLLLRAGAEPDARSHGGFTALHIAAQIGAIEMVGALLEAGSDPRARTDGGKTPVDFAIDGDHAEVVARLEDALRALSSR
jgi:ankyrin repeat protein